MRRRGPDSRLWFLSLATALVLPAAVAGQVVQPAPVPQPWQAPPQPYRPPPIFPAYLLPLFVVVVAAHRLKKQREQEEEEEVTPHLTDPATAFEYKIIRGMFQKPDKLRAMLDDEARAGWELFELLDGARARLRRPTTCRARDGDLTQDPYRTTYLTGQGPGAQKVVLVIFAVIAVIAVAVATIAVIAAVSK
jgi:hypothetical protein